MCQLQGKKVGDTVKFSTIIEFAYALLAGVVLINNGSSYYYDKNTNMYMVGTQELNRAWVRWNKYFTIKVIPKQTLIIIL